MRPIDTMTAAQAGGLQAIFTDIDGTITDSEGRLPAEVFAVMERARAAGMKVVPITGRPAGWCDMIARTWPVDGVVGENGGLYFRRDVDRDGTERMHRVFVQDDATRAASRARLKELSIALLERHPGAALASDQQYREYDLAVDFCEDVPPLPESEIDGIVAFLEEAGCHVKVSNIHVNAWFGDFDKASMCRRYVGDVWGWDLADGGGGRAVFFGDSPNDEPLFALFELSVGVANVRAMVDRMEALPTFVTEGACCDGFVEAVERILRLRG
jgi:HAD superfamily hydrolase (TIGR01484 family)